MFQDRIKAEIEKREAFFLFWSRHASESKWVNWEIETARGKPGAAAFLVMALEHASLIPSLPGFEGRQIGDRYIMVYHESEWLAEVKKKLEGD